MASFALTPRVAGLILAVCVITTFPSLGSSRALAQSKPEQATGQDPLIGSWKEDRSMSKYEPAATNTTPAEVKIEAAGSGYKITNAGSAPLTVSTLDGKDYPSNPATGSTTSWLRMDPNTAIAFNRLKDGTVVRIQRSAVSKDGKTLAVNRVGYNTDANGKRTAFHQDVTYKKQ